jgi:hypothetical protein
MLSESVDLRIALPSGNLFPVSTDEPQALETLADRVWYALHCMPRNAAGKPPSWRSFEANNDLPHAVLSKLFNGERTWVQPSTLTKMAAAFGVSMEWLASGVGSPPTPTGRIPPRGADLYAQFKPENLAVWHAANPAKPAPRPHNPGQVRPRDQHPTFFEEGAAEFLRDHPSETRLVARERERARGRENDVSAIGWYRAMLKTMAEDTRAKAERAEARQKRVAKRTRRAS